MAQPLYFLPNLRKRQLESIALVHSVLRERGLLDVFADVPFQHLCINELTGRGPGDKSGVILAYQTPKGDVPRRLDYKPNEQAWTAVGDGSLVWIGLDTAEPPTADEMARRQRYGGYPLELNYGTWLVPLIRRVDGGTELPTDMVWDSTGNLIEPLKPAYQAYWDESAEVAEWFFREGNFGGPTYTKGRALELAVHALGINYRFGRYEQNVLRVIDSQNVLSILGMSIDAPSAFEAAQKKSLATSSSPGCEDSTPDTAPPGENSI